jgi:molybdenum transport protein
MYWTYEDIDRLINEDMPSFDLTSLLMGIKENGKISFFTRKDTLSTANDLVGLIAKKLNLKIKYVVRNGVFLKAGEKLFEASGENVLILWKVVQNIYEYGCGVAYYTHQMTKLARKHNPHMEILTTRKVIPFTKKIALQAVMDGGGMPHRITTSETVLVFDNYINLYGGWDNFLKNFEELKYKTIEKKWVVEAKDKQMAKKLINIGVDVLQLDKVDPKTTKEIVQMAHKQGVLVLSAGGVNLDNIEEYAKTGTDSVVTTAPYFAKSADIKVVIE